MTKLIICKKIYFLVLITIIYLIPIVQYGQSMQINDLDNSNVQYQISDISNITYQQNFMELTFIDGTFLFYDLNNVMSVKFNSLNVGNSEILRALNDFHFNISPNPVDENINISFELKNDDRVKIEILDSRGSIIFTLFDGNMKSGEKSIYKSMSLLKPGTYFCIVQTSRFTTRKTFIKL